jgi:hypothetical protein
MPESSPPPLPHSSPKRKGLPALAWVGIGCGGILVVALIVILTAFAFLGRKVADFARQAEENPAKAAAELFVKANPEVELVSIDDQAGTMTIRIKATGKEATVTYADIAQGKFSVTSEDGEFRVKADPAGGGSAKVTIKRSNESVSYVSGAEAASKVPEWVIAAAYPGAPRPHASFAAEAAGVRSGSLGTVSNDDIQQVAQYYREFLKQQGYEVNENSTASEGGKMIFLSGGKEQEGKTLVVVCTESPDGTQIFLSFEESTGGKKP